MMEDEQEREGDEVNFWVEVDFHVDARALWFSGAACTPLSPKLDRVDG